MLSNVESKLPILKSIIKKAGAILLSFYDSPTGIEKKLDQTMVSDADKAASTFIVQELRKQFPEIPIVDEEGMSKGYDHKSRYCWIIDPLDGTREFLAHRVDFGILIGLVEDGVPIFGITLRPLINEVTWGIKGRGSYLENADGIKKLAVNDSRDVVVLVSGSRSDPELVEILKKIGAKQIIEKHSAFKLIDVAKGEASLYICSRVNTMHIWDTCAPAIILQEAGGKTTDLYGHTLDYSFKRDDHERGIIASNNLVHRKIVEKVSSIVR